MTNLEYRADTSEPTKAMGGTAARGGVATLVANGAAQAIRLGSNVFMSRLLTPEQFGLFAMINAAVGIAGLLRDLGLSSATIQSPTLSQRQLSTLFWINAGFGLFATVAIVGGSHWIAAALHAPESTTIIVCLAASFFLVGLAVQHRALLSRKLAFVVLARITFWAALISQGIVLLLAVFGAGIWALVIGALAVELILAISYWIAEPWRPSKTFSLAEVRPMLIFGGYLAAFNILGYLVNNLQQVLIGIYSGTVSAGYFNRAYILVQGPIYMILLPVGGVVTAILARAQSDPPAFAHYYLRSVATVNLLSAPLGFYSLLFAPEIVRLLLGSGWDESGVLLRIMATSVVVQPLMMSTGWIYTALGWSRRAFWWGNLGWSVILVMYIPGLHWGARGVAAANSLAQLVLLWPCLLFAFRGTHIKPIEALRVCGPAVTAAAIAMIPAWFLYEQLHNLTLLPALFASSFIYAFFYLCLLVVLGEKPRLFNLWRLLSTRISV